MRPHTSKASGCCFRWSKCGLKHKHKDVYSLNYLTLCKERYRDLSWIGLGPWDMSVMRRDMNWEYESEPDSDSDPEDDFSHNKLARKMKNAGWPGDGEGWDWDRTKFERLVSQGNDEEE